MPGDVVLHLFFHYGQVKNKDNGQKGLTTQGNRNKNQWNRIHIKNGLFSFSQFNERRKPKSQRVGS
jgi:hypothetical protein